MTRRFPDPRHRRKVLVVLLVAVAIGMIIVEPIPSYVVLLTLTETHGIDVGDLPAIALLLVIAWLVRRA